MLRRLYTDVQMSVVCELKSFVMQRYKEFLMLRDWLKHVNCAVEKFMDKPSAQDSFIKTAHCTGPKTDCLPGESEFLISSEPERTENYAGHASDKAHILNRLRKKVGIAQGDFATECQKNCNIKWQFIFYCVWVSGLSRRDRFVQTTSDCPKVAYMSCRVFCKQFVLTINQCDEALKSNNF